MRYRIGIGLLPHPIFPRHLRRRQYMVFDGVLEGILRCTRSQFGRLSNVFAWLLALVGVVPVIGFVLGKLL